MMENQPRSTAAHIEKAADVDIAEFESLRDEVFARMESQRQSFNYVITLSAAVLALVGSSFGTAGGRLDHRLVVFVPLLVAPLAFIFFDNEFLLWSIGRYIRQELGPRLSDAVGRPVLQLGPRRGMFPSRLADSLHFALSLGRWLLFLLPVALPLWYALRIDADVDWPYVPPFWVVALLDCLVLLLLLMSIGAAIRMRTQVWHTNRGT